MAPQHPRPVFLLLPHGTADALKSAMDAGHVIGHCGGQKTRHPHLCLHAAHDRKSLLVLIHRILPPATMDMDIDEPRRNIAPRRIHHLIGTVVPFRHGKHLPDFCIVLYKAIVPDRKISLRIRNDNIGMNDCLHLYSSHRKDTYKRYNYIISPATPANIAKIAQSHSPAPIPRRANERYSFLSVRLEFRFSITCRCSRSSATW